MGTTTLPMMVALPLPNHDLDHGVIDPYRLFFPLGVINGFLGVIVWPLYALGFIHTIASLWHIDLQLHGFLMAFVLGFLLTALPRFSLTRHITWAELAFFVPLFIVGNAATAFGFYPSGRLAHAFTLTLLIIFAARRFSRRKSDPPPEFVFVGAGIWVGWVAAILRVIGTLSESNAILDLAGRRLFSEGMMVLLILGIGGKLAPMFWGLDGGSPVIPRIGNRSLWTRRHLAYLSIALVYVISFPIEYLTSEAIGLYLRASAATLIFFGTMKIHRAPKTGGVVVQILRISSWLVWLSLWGSAIHPFYRVEVLHVMFIGGFGVMILTIATRVILSHGGYPLEMERRSRSLLLAAILLLIALMLRVGATFFPERFFEILGVAGTLWIVGLSLWGVVYSRRAIKLQVEPSSPSSHTS